MERKKKKVPDGKRRASSTKVPEIFLMERGRGSFSKRVKWAGQKR